MAFSLAFPFDFPFFVCPPPIRVLVSKPPPPPIFQVVRFYEDIIQVTVAKNTHQVDWWITCRALPLLRNHPNKKFVVGLDTEWRPNVAKGEDNPVAILQLCIGNECLIYQFLHGEPIPPMSNLRTFLQDPRFIFCGVEVEDDVKKLKEHHGLCVGFVGDLNEMAKGINSGLKNYKYSGLKKMAKLVLGKEMAKPMNVTMSAWDAQVLDTDQIEYAAIDAFVSSQLAWKLRFSLPLDFLWN